MITLETEAADKKQGMTLAELGELMRQAVELQVPLSTPVRVTVGWSGQVQKVVVKS